MQRIPRSFAQFRKELQELLGGGSGEFSSGAQAEMLLEFVATMLLNKKELNHITEELNDLISPEETVTLTNWLIQWTGKYELSPKSVIPSTHVLLPDGPLEEDGGMEGIEEIGEGGRRGSGSGRVGGGGNSRAFQLALGQAVHSKKAVPSPNSTNPTSSHTVSTSSFHQSSASQESRDFRAPLHTTHGGARDHPNQSHPPTTSSSGTYPSGQGGERRDLRLALSARNGAGSGNKAVGGGGGKDLRDLLSRRATATSLGAESRGNRHEDDISLGGGGPQRRERHVVVEQRKTPYSIPLRKVPPPSSLPRGGHGGYSLSQKKCSYFPNCPRVNCSFFHPFEPCERGAACPDKEGCMFTHPSTSRGANGFGGGERRMEVEKEADEKVKEETFTPPTACKFGVHCTNPSCTFSHPSPAAAAAAALKSGGGGGGKGGGSSTTTYCKFQEACLNPYCTFYHKPIGGVGGGRSFLPPTGLAGAPSASIPGGVVPPPLDASTTVCKFDPNCTRVGCYFVHPSRNETLGVGGGGTSARPFINADEPVERMIVD